MELFVVNFSTALATSCQVYPSEYAYEDDSVTRVERASANCRRYPPATHSQSIHPEHYTHCDGTRLKLTDSNFGQKQYQISDYYVWSSRTDEQLLFIFPTRVSLTNITLHYYRDHVRGLPTLIFYAVPDDFGVWDVPTIHHPHADVAEVQPGRELAGHKSVNIVVNIETKKLVMYKYGSNFKLEVSEVQFFICSYKLIVNIHPVLYKLLYQCIQQLQQLLYQSRQRALQQVRPRQFPVILMAVLNI